MRARSISTASGVFQTVTVLHIAYTAAILVYFVTGEVMKAAVFPPDPGFVNFGSPTIWVIRGALATVGAIGLALENTLFSDEPTVRRMLARATEVTDGTVAAALQTAHVLRLAYVEAVAIQGFVLFMLDGHRYDLYGFGLVAFVNLIAIRPSRDKWEAAFRRAALDHPGVSSLPWQAASL